MLALVMVSAAALPLFADGPDLADKTISDWSFGATVVGDEPTEANLKGRVVVIEFWGVR